MKKRMDAQHRALISEANRGSNHWRTKLSDDIVRRIYAQRGKKTAIAISVAMAFEDIEVSQSMIYSIWIGRTWAHVTGVMRRDKRQAEFPK